jgi:N-acetylmuramoyl-L-alanine amidase
VGLPPSPAARLPALALIAALALAGCADQVRSPTPAGSAAPSAPATGLPSPSSTDPSPALVVPAPGPVGSVYPPNPGAIVVAIDPGHGGCLDWGVPDPSQRGASYAEKTMTLDIAEVLRDRLLAEGVEVLLLREGDTALAGDDYEPLGCEGGPWRDVNGDGVAGFGPDVPEATRTRDELQARLDLANLARADLLVSIHINSPSDDGQIIEIAFTETFYTDETPWGPTATQRLAALVQDHVVESLAGIADYERGDRGATAHNFYMVAPTLFEPTAERPDPYRQPARGALMPTVLSEVGSITLRAEHDLLVSPDGQAAVADGLLEAVAGYLAERSLAVRIGLAAAPALDPPPAVPGDGPPFWPAEIVKGTVSVRLTNTGTEAWPDGLRLMAGWGPTGDPYLAARPSDLVELDAVVPPLAPGEAVELPIALPEPPGGGRQVAWITLADGGRLLSDLGSPALQLAARGGE